MKERIIDSTWRQILKYGVKRFTVQDIAADLGISKKTIYAHFNSKEEIIEAVCANLAAADRASHMEALESKAGFFEKLDLLINAHCHRQMPLSFRAELNRYYPEIFEKHLNLAFPRTIYRELIEQGIKEGYIRADIHPAIIELILDKSLEALDDNKFLIDYDITVQQGLQILRNVLLYGVLEPERR
ncbi:MAG: helix-turn-helix domain-containing protein [Syntrophomonadaceae bacterium]